MKLENHIVLQLLKDEQMWVDAVIEHAKYNDGVDLLDKNINFDEAIAPYMHMYQLLNDKGNKTFYLTKSVVEHMDLFDTKKCMTAEGWRIFNTLPDFKKTFILPEPSTKDAPHGGSECLRVSKTGGVLQFFHLSHRFYPKEQRTRTVDGHMGWVMLYVDMEKEVLCDHMNSQDGQNLAPFLYALMCFVELCDNQVVEVKPKAQWGTRKAGKIINVLPFPITVINNTWNVMTVRTEGFTVSGHVHLYWTGPGRTIPKLKYVSPYAKEGYTRRSGKELHDTR